MGAHGALKIVMPTTCGRYLWWAGSRLVGFIFVSRRKRHARPQNDVEEIQRGVSEIAEGQAPSLILLFPEGTTVNEEGEGESDPYAYQGSGRDMNCCWHLGRPASWPRVGATSHEAFR